MRPSRFAARLADAVVDALWMGSAAGPWWGCHVADVTIGGARVVLGLVETEPGRRWPPGTPAEAVFVGWSDLVEVFRSAWLDHVERGVRSLRLVLPASAVLGGLRPHDDGRQSFRLRRVVGSRNCDSAARMLWLHGRSLLPMLTPSVVVAEPDSHEIPERMLRAVRWARRRGACLGFGGVDVGAWGLGRVRNAAAMTRAAAATSPVREVVELVRESICEVSHVRHE